MTTPWISYRIDLERAPVRLWNAFGRIQAHGEALRQMRLAPDAAAEMLQRWRRPAAAATAALVGHPAGASDAPSEELTAAVLAVYESIDAAVDGDGNSALRPETLCRTNAALADLAAAAASECGDLAAQFAGPVSESWARLGQFCLWLEGQDFRAPEADALQTAVLRAFGATFHLSLLDPFRLCNAATAELLGYRILRLAGLPPMTAHLPAVVRAGRADRFREIMAEARANNGGPIAYVTEVVAGMLEGMREQLAASHATLAQAAWSQHIESVFCGRSGKAERRRRMLLNGLSAMETPVRLGRLRRLTPSLAEAYAGRSDKTLSRDIIWLEQEGLLVRGLAGVRLRREALAAPGQAA